MDKLEQLYNLYVGKGLITRQATSLDKWRSATSQQREALFKLGVENNLFVTTTLEQFHSAWTPVADKKKDDTDSVLETGSSEPVENTGKSYFERQSERARSIRTGHRVNQKGQQESHLMAWGESDGRYVVYPTLFQTKEGEWYESEDAFEEAKKRDELFWFDNPDRAKQFAAGGWKPRMKLPRSSQYPTAPNNDPDYSPLDGVFELIQSKEGTPIDESELNLEIPEMVDPEDEAK